MKILWSKTILIHTQVPESKTHYGAYTTGKLIRKNFRNFLKHSTDNHGKPNFACSYCNKPFIVKSSLQNDTTFVHHGSEHFTCSYCGNSLGLNGDLQNRIAVERTSVKKLRCVYCNKLFSRKENTNKLKKIIYI